MNECDKRASVALLCWLFTRAICLLQCPTLLPRCRFCTSRISIPVFASLQFFTPSNTFAPKKRKTDRVVNAGVTPCRYSDVCWRPLCPCRHSGGGRAAMWARVENPLRQPKKLLVSLCRSEVIQPALVERIKGRVADQMVPSWMKPWQSSTEEERSVQQERVQQWTVDVPMCHCLRCWTRPSRWSGWSRVNECNNGLSSKLLMCLSFWKRPSRW